MTDLRIRPDLNLWGKSAGDMGTYPLAAHLLDTGSVLLAYMNGGWVSQRHREYLCELVGLDDVSAFASRLAVLAALHDVGKATPHFQSKLSGNVAGDGRSVGEVLTTYPTTLTDSDPSDLKKLSRHALVSGLAHKRTSEVNDFSADVLGGHHGTFGAELAEWDPSKRRIDTPFSSCRQLWDETWSPNEWVCQWEALQALCATAFGSDPLTISTRVAVPFITQLVVIADWVASGEALRSTAPVHLLEQPSRYVEEQAVVASKALPELFGQPVPDTTGLAFSEVFPELKEFGPRPLQESVARLPVTPGLTLIAAPMGVGKTEAALLRAFTGSSGLYFALPTGATSKVMFERVRDFVSEVSGGGVAANVLYKNSSLNAFYNDEGEASTHPDDDDAGPVARRWLSGRHKALLSPVGVGTVDRILHGVFPHRYGFLKLGALAGRTVVLDEVHSYDAYTSGLISRLIEWLAVSGADVVLLSATIPKDITQQFFTAYRVGCGAACGVSKTQVPEINFSYPAVMHMQAGINTDVTVEPLASDEYTLQLEFVDGGNADQIADTTLGLLSQRSACFTAVIVNTVKTAQTVSALLGEQGDLDVHVLHSRMTANQRDDATDRVTALFGKNRPDTTSRHQVLVSTQIAEQSLDLDFDVMVSQLAPFASLLQRSGRLWRHERGEREGSRTLYVTKPDENMDTYPYGQSRVLRTWNKVLNEGTRSDVNVPSQVQDLVDAGYDTSDAADLAENQTMSIEAGTAEMNALPSPRKLRTVVELTNGSTKATELLTRLGADSIGVIVCGADSKWSWKGDLPEHPTKEQQAQILGCVVPVASTGAGKNFLKAHCHEPTVTARWVDSAPLLGGLKVTSSEHLDDTLGLIW